MANDINPVTLFVNGLPASGANLLPVDLPSLTSLLDGLEGLIGTSNTLLTALGGYVDGLEALAAAPTPAGTNNIGKVTPEMTSGGNIAVQTAATGANYTAFASQACKQITIVNNTGTMLEFRQGAAGIAVPIFNQNVFTIFGITNASQIDVRRVDQSNTQVTAQARWEA